MTHRPTRSAAERRRTSKGLVQVSILLEPEMLDEIRAIAERDRVSFTEQVRLLIEWGIEDVNTFCEPRLRANGLAASSRNL